MLPSSDLARLLSMRTIFRSILLVIEILAWYAFGRWVYHKEHPRNSGDLLETAWGVIANAGGWNHEEGVSCATTGWEDAAIRWRDDYFHWLRRHPIHRKEAA